MGQYNVICIKWGSKYPAEEVNKLYRSIRKNTSYDINFYCFTENANDLSKDIIIKELPDLKTIPEYNYLMYKKEVALCNDDLGGLKGQRVFFFDLDSLIVGNLDEFFNYPQGEQFYIINDWRHRWGPRKNTIGQASCYSWVVGTLGYIKQYFEAHPKEVIAKYWSASQEYLSAKVIEKNGHLNFWPDGWFKSFRFHCVPNYIMRWIVAPKMPKNKDLKMIAFHGATGIQDALDGVWSREIGTKKYPSGLKKLYKHIKPTLWIKDYWG